MNVLWNQVKKDVRSIRLLLAVWLVIEVGLAVLVGSGVDARFWDDRTVYLIDTEHRIVLYLATAIFALVAIALVQADRLVGTTVFWLTRPVGRSTLLASKAIVAVAFLVLVPLALDAIVFFASGVTPPDLWQALAQQLAGQVLFLLPVLAVAALTPNIARFVLVGVLGILAWLVVDAGVRALGLPNRAVGAFVAGEFAALTLMAIACLILIVHQYLTRRTRRSSLVGGAGIAGMLVIFLTWPWPMPASPLPAVDVRQFDPAAVTIPLGADQLHLREYSITNLLQADATVHYLPPGFQVRQEDVRTTLRFAGGTLVGPGEKRWGYPDVLGDHVDLLRRALGPVRVIYSRPVWSPPSPSLNLLQIPARTIEEHGNQAARCKTDILFGVWTDRVAAEVPAHAGARFWYGGFWRGDIVDVTLTGHGVWMRTRESGVRLRSGDLAPRYGYVLLNRPRGEAIVGTATQTFVFWPNYPPVPSAGTFDVRHADVDFSAYYPKDRDLTVNQAWLDGATLVIVETALMGTFTRSIDFGDIVLASLPRR